MLFPTIITLNELRVDFLSAMNAESTMGFGFLDVIANFAIAV
jgi:hypothetical protein